MPYYFITVISSIRNGCFGAIILHMFQFISSQQALFALILKPSKQSRNKAEEILVTTMGETTIADDCPSKRIKSNKKPSPLPAC